MTAKQNTNSKNWFKVAAIVSRNNWQYKNHTVPVIFVSTNPGLENIYKIRTLTLGNQNQADA